MFVSCHQYTLKLQGWGYRGGEQKKDDSCCGSYTSDVVRVGYLLQLE